MNKLVTEDGLDDYTMVSPGLQKTVKINKINNLFARPDPLRGVLKNVLVRVSQQ